MPSDTAFGVEKGTGVYLAQLAGTLQNAKGWIWMQTLGSVVSLRVVEIFADLLTGRGIESECDVPLMSEGL